MKSSKTTAVRAFILVALLTVIFVSCKKGDTATTTPTTDPIIVTNVQPKNPMPGDVVTITGTGFGTTFTDVKVTIGTQVITISSVTNTEIKFTLPAGITAGDIAVAIKGILATNNDPQKATITPGTPVPVAKITAINPTSGKVGDVVTITGTNFSTTATDDVVKFNGVVATITVATATTLTTTVPATATTGPVSLSVKNAVVVTGPSFTVNASSGGAGTAVTYINVLSGNATFGKVASATTEIGAMKIDKINNILYYSDYSPFTSNHPGALYKLKLDGSTPVAVTTDTRISSVQCIATDAGGNIYVATNAGSNKINVYKLDAATAAITVIATNASAVGAGDTFNVDSQGGLWFGYGQKLNVSTGNLDRNATFPYGSFQNALFQGDNVYVDDNHASGGGDIAFYKYNLLTKVGTATDFTLNGMFKQDNPSMPANLDVQSRYALDNNENFYTMYPIVGDAASSSLDYYVIRKTKNGNGGASTLISKFYTKFYSGTTFYQSPRLNTGILFQADASGNLYMKDNGTDIIKITQ